MYLLNRSIPKHILLLLLHRLIFLHLDLLLNLFESRVVVPRIEWIGQLPVRYMHGGIAARIQFLRDVIGFHVVVGVLTFLRGTLVELLLDFRGKCETLILVILVGIAILRLLRWGHRRW